MTLQKRVHSTAAAAAAVDTGHPVVRDTAINQVIHSANNTSSQDELNQHTASSTPPRQSVSINIHSSQPYSPHKKRSKQQPDTVLLMLILFLIFMATLTTLHNKIDQFERESQQQTRFLRKTIDNLLFDPMALPQYSNLHGRYTGCMLIDGRIAPHNYDEAIFVDKELDIVQNNGSGTNLVNRYRLREYDYEEVKGIVAGFENAFVYGAEPIVYDCHVKFRPGGASALDVHGFGVALNQFTLNNGGGVDVPKNVPAPPFMHGGINVINGTAVLIAQYWGELGSLIGARV